MLRQMDSTSILLSYIGFAILIAIGIFGRQTYVYLRKYGFRKEYFKPEEIVRSIYGLIGTVLMGGALNSFLAMGFDISKPSIFIIALLYGAFGNDITHQIIAKYNQIKLKLPLPEKA